MSDAVWRHPEAFWLLWLLPVVAGLAFLAHRRVRRAALQFAGEVMAPRLLPPLHWSGPLCNGALRLVGLALVMLALARPCWDVDYRTIRSRGLDVVVVFDVSRSMLADDRGDSRLGRAKSAVSWLVDNLEGDRVALIPFAGEHLLSCPLTLDRAFFQQALADAGPEMVGRGGTKVGPALEAAADVLDVEWDRDQLVVLVTDGGDQESFPRRAGERLAERDVPVIAVGVGDATEGEPLVLDGRPVRRADGSPVMARLNAELLEEIAVETGGMYVPPEDVHRLPELYDEHFADLRRGDNEELQERHLREKYQWFLAPGILLLLLQAGRPAYRRPRSAAQGASRPSVRRAGRACVRSLLAGALAGLAALGLVRCGPSAETFEEAVAAFEAEDYSRAETLFLDLAEEGRGEAVVDYDLGCLHQAQGRPLEARRHYVKVLEHGDRELRARARVNLATLSVDEMLQRAGEDPATLEGSRRDDVVQRAEWALDELQRARRLDPELPGLEARQDALARWLRVQQDRWRMQDRDRAREERAKRQGADFLRGLIEAQDQLVRALQEGELLEDLVLRQRDLADELRQVSEHFEDEGAALAAPFREEVAAAAAELAPRLEGVAGLLREARTRAAVEAIAGVREEMLALWALWAEPAAVVGRLAEGHRAAHQRLRAVLRQGGLEGRSDDELRAMEDRVEGLRRVARNLARALEAPTDAAASPTGPGAAGADPSAAPEPSLFERRLSAAAPELEAKLDEQRARTGARDAAALEVSTELERRLRDLSLEAQLSGMEATELARRLEQLQHGLVRGARVIAELEGIGSASESAVDSQARERTEQLAEQRAELWHDAGQQSVRLDYLDAVLQELPVPLDLPEDATEQQREEARARARREFFGGLKAVLDRGAAALDPEIIDAAAEPPDAVAALGAGRTLLRRLWMQQSELGDLLRGAAEEQAGLAGDSLARAQRTPPPAPSAPSTTAGPDPARAAAELDSAVGFAEQRDEQALVAELGELLVAVLPAQREALARQLEAARAPAPPPEDADPGEAAAEEASAAAPAGPPPDELEAQIEVLGTLQGLLEPAGEAARSAATALETAEAGDLAARADTLAQVQPDQQRAAELYAEALKKWEEASMSLLQLAERLMQGEDGLLRAARGLEAAERLAREVSEEGEAGNEADAAAPGWAELRAAQESAAVFVARLPRALERHLREQEAAAQQAAMQQGGAAGDPGAGLPPPPSPAADEPREESEDERALRRSVREVEDAVTAATESLRQAEQTEGRDGLQAVDALEVAVGATRALWSRLAQFQELVERGVEEQTREIIEVDTLSRDEGPRAEDTAEGRAFVRAVRELAGDQRRTRELIPAMSALLPSLQQQAELFELAQKNLPAAEAAMEQALARLEDSELIAVRDPQEEARRLLEEILEKMQDDQQDEQEQPQEQPEPQDSLSPEELERLQQAVQERNRRPPETRPRTAVEEDW